MKKQNINQVQLWYLLQKAENIDKNKTKKKLHGNEAALAAGLRSLKIKWTISAGFISIMGLVMCLACKNFGFL